MKVIGNLPYYITQQFLEQLLPLGHLVSNAILLLQVSCEPIKLVYMWFNLHGSSEVQAKDEAHFTL